MALINCTECGKEISDKASSCPNCGCPLESNENASKEQNPHTEVDTSKTITNDKELIEEHAPIGEEKSKKKLNKKALVILLSILGILIIGGGIAFILTSNLRAYNSAQKLMNEKQYNASATAYAKLGDYKDSVSKYNESQYMYATQLFLNEKYSDAEPIFNDLGDYQDSKEQYELCQYRQSADWNFIVSMKTGLQKRWDISESDVDQSNNTKYSKHLKDCVNSELDELNKVDINSISEESLKKDATNYMELLNNSAQALNYYTTDYNQYATMWDSIYSERTLLIRKFINDHGLVIDGQYQDTVDDFLASAQVVDESKALESDVNRMLENFTVELTKDQYGSKTYILTMENTTDVTFEYFGVTVDFLDENDVIVNSQYSGEAKNFEPGQIAQFDIYSNKDYVSLNYHPNYSKKS